MKDKLLFFFFLPFFLSCKENDIIRIRVNYNKEIKSNVSDRYISSEQMFKLNDITLKGITHNHIKLIKQDTVQNKITYSYSSDESNVKTKNIDHENYTIVGNSVKMYEVINVSSEKVDSYTNVKQKLKDLNEMDSLILLKKNHLFSTSFKNDKYQGYVKEYFDIDSSKNRFTYTNSVYLELKNKSLKITHTIISTPNNKHLINSSRKFINSIEVDNN